MRFLVLVAAVVAIAFAEDVEAPVEVEEPKPEESAHHYGDSIHSFSDGLELMRHREQRFNDEHLERDAAPSSSHGPTGPVILRTPGPLPHDGHPDIKAQNKIIEDVYSPDYYQPTWVLDYRYLKTGGRDYTRGPGGQILILPKGVRSNEHKEFPDYDAYIEHLRLSRLAEKQRQSHGHSDDYDYWQYGQRHTPGPHGYDNQQGHGQTLWHKY